MSSRRCRRKTVLSPVGKGSTKRKVRGRRGAVDRNLCKGGSANDSLACAVACAAPITPPWAAWAASCAAWAVACATSPIAEPKAARGSAVRPRLSSSRLTEGASLSSKKSVNSFMPFPQRGSSQEHYVVSERAEWRGEAVRISHCRHQSVISRDIRFGQRPSRHPTMQHIWERHDRRGAVTVDQLLSERACGESERTAWSAVGIGGDPKT